MPDDIVQAGAGLFADGLKIETGRGVGLAALAGQRIRATGAALVEQQYMVMLEQ